MAIWDGLLRILQGGKEEKPDERAKPVDKALLAEKVRETDLFRDLPDDNLDKMFDHMEKVPMKKGETVIREGDEGDYYYLLAQGTAKVLRRGPGQSEQQVVAELTEPTAFGEEALISNAKRNATVTMTSPGEVMRLSKDAFNDYVKEPVITWFSPSDAQRKIQEGARWIDVRPPDETRESHLPNALLIPMGELRDRAGELDKEKTCICYCSNGRLSSTASFLLRQRGYDAGVLRGGLKSLREAGVA
ncbi:MAG: cyclic nucleotide-binding domain-containing protein [Kiritimatiellia bacterium]